MTDGITTKAYQTGRGFVMKGKTNDISQNYFSFASGYSLSLQNTCNSSFNSSGYTTTGFDNRGSADPIFIVLYPSASLYNIFSIICTAFPCNSHV